VEENNILKTLTDLSLKCDLQLNFALYQDNILKNMCSNIDYYPYCYTLDHITYQLAYQESYGGVWFDISCVIKWGKNNAAIWPLTLCKEINTFKLSSQGQAINPPLFTKFINKLEKKIITKSCLKFLVMVSELYNIKLISFSDTFNYTLGLSDWNLFLRELGAEFLIYNDLYLQILDSTETTISGFKRKLIYDIAWGKKLWSNGILTSESESFDIIWQEFQDLHKQASGRLTRSLKSWEFQKQAIIEKNAILVFLRNDSRQMVGGGYFTYSKDEAIYAVAAHDRSLFKFPIGHLIQYLAIEKFIDFGIKWYKIGNLSSRFDVPTPSEKEISISQFKRKFCSHIFPRYHFNCNIHKLKEII
jgi:FemAB family protein